jgi:hypothetical protein
MKKFALLLPLLWAVGGAGFVRAQNSMPFEKVTPDISAMEQNHPMIFELRDRIRNQRERIDEGVMEHTLAIEQAMESRAVLESVEKQMKSDYKTNGTEKTMKLKRDQYSALNGILDSNSKTIHEMKTYFYYYDPYFEHYYAEDPVFDAPQHLIVSALEEDHPMIFELRDRIRNQRDRIDEGLTANTLSMTQASAGLEVLRSVENKMKTDYKANGSNNTKMRLTQEQYVAFNTTLDANSIVLHEGKEFFYYYGPYYNQYWF